MSDKTLPPGVTDAAEERGDEYKHITKDATVAGALHEIIIATDAYEVIECLSRLLQSGFYTKVKLSVTAQFPPLVNQGKLHVLLKRLTEDDE